MKGIRLNGVSVLLLVLCVLPIANCKSIIGVSDGEVEQRVFQLINEHRVAMRLNVLQWDGTIARACRDHSAAMAEGTVPVGHEGFDLRVAEIRTVFPNSVAFGENVAFVSGRANPSEYIVDQWLANADHRKNIEGDYNLTGVGVAHGGSDEYYITQIFVKNK